jgi:hypothetical protein
VSPGLFTNTDGAFPTRRQMLADDLVRCKTLTRASPDEIEGTIGPPDQRSTYKQVTYFTYFLGPERESLVQIDPEFLSVSILDEKVVRVSIDQG